MLAQSSPTTPRRSVHGLARRRWLLSLWALCLIVFFIYTYAFVVPFNTLWVNWTPHGQAVIGLEVPRPADVAAGQPWPQVGDVLQAIDGIPVRYSDLYMRFGPAAAAHTYELRRGDEVFTAMLPSGTPASLELLNLLMPAIVALEAWLLGFIIVLLARTEDRDAWLAGFVMLGLAVAVAAAPAGGAGVPGARLAYGVLVPIMSIGYLEMALLPRNRASRRNWTFVTLYGIGLALAAGAVIEILFLNPAATWQSVIGVRLESVSLGLLSLSILAAPAVMAVRALRHRSGYSRRQVIILLFGTGVALLPFVLLSALPQAIVGSTIVPVELTLPLLGAIPATYAYVIYRHRYLKLDLYASRSLLLVIAGLIVAVVFFAGMRVSQATVQMASVSPIIGMVSLLIGFGLVRQAHPRLMPAIDFMLFGPDRHFDQALKDFTDDLSANPQTQTLIAVLGQRMPTMLEVRDSAVFLATPGGDLALAQSTPGSAGAIAELHVLSTISGLVLRQTSPHAPVFQVFPWARLAVPLRVSDRVTGAVLLGAKHGDANFDLRETQFVERVGISSGIAHENIRLVESLQDIAQERLRIRSQERLQLANRLHDMPLQRIHAIAQSLDRVSMAAQTGEDVVQPLATQRESARILVHELRDICAGLRPPIMSQGLSLTLSQVVSDFCETNPEISIDALLECETEPELGEQALDAAYHVVTEALNNVSRHSGASQARVSLEVTPAAVRICISDNGRGTRLTEASRTALVRDRHYGMASMREWAIMAGGQLDFLPASPTGTMVQLHLPINGNHAG
jgi:signal transduction histidine kinase